MQCCWFKALKIQKVDDQCLLKDFLKLFNIHIHPKYTDLCFGKWDFFFLCFYELQPGLGKLK